VIVRRAEVFEVPRARASTHLTTGLVDAKVREWLAGAGEESMERISKLVERRRRGGSRALRLQYFRRLVKVSHRACCDSRLGSVKISRQQTAKAVAVAGDGWQKWM
jgi:hypothetical protein